MTIFTEIIEGKLPGYIIFEDKNHVAILDKYPIDTGHSLIIPKKPYEKIIDMPTECGTVLRKGKTQSQNAEIVDLLKSEGAIIMGKTATSELAYLGPPPTRNPVTGSSKPVSFFF